MLKRTFKYTDFNGVEREEDHFFNLTEAEIVELQTGTVGGFADDLRKIISLQDQVSVAKTIKKFILDSYGEKSADGRLFVKLDQNGNKLSRLFESSVPYSQLYTELMYDDVKAAEFINGIIPVSLTQSQEYQEELKKLEVPLVQYQAPIVEVVPAPQAKEEFLQRSNQYAAYPTGPVGQ